MKLAMEIRRLGRRRRLAIGVSLVVGLLVAVGSIERISLLPPKLSPRDVEIATAHTSVVIDSPASIILDNRSDAYNFQSLQNRAILLGNVIASTPVLQYIAQQVRVPPDVIAISAPATPEEPLPRVIAGHRRSVTDLLRYANQYRLSIEANPTAPVLDIYSEAPTKAAAITLANAAVDGLKSYMSSVAAARRVPAPDQVVVTQLGRAEGGITNPGAQWQLAVLAFIAGFFVSLGVILAVVRIRRGWVIGGNATDHSAAG
jgi:hypothetical protein